MRFDSKLLLQSCYHPPALATTLYLRQKSFSYHLWVYDSPSTSGLLGEVWEIKVEQINFQRIQVSSKDYHWKGIEDWLRFESLLLNSILIASLNHYIILAL